MAGFFVAAAPVVFGILYSCLTALRPGLIADATVQLPGLRTATISVPSGASITLAADTAIQDGSTQWAKVRGGGSYQITPGATIQVAAGVQAIARPCYEAAERAVADVLAKAVADVLAKAVADASAEAAVRASVDAAVLAVQQVVERTLKCTRSLPLERIRSSFDPVPGQLAQLADLRRGDPRFGQPAIRSRSARPPASFLSS